MFLSYPCLILLMSLCLDMLVFKPLFLVAENTFYVYTSGECDILVGIWRGGLKVRTRIGLSLEGVSRWGVYACFAVIDGNRCFYSWNSEPRRPCLISRYFIFCES